VLPRPRDETPDVPIFLHFMVGSGGTPAFTPLAPLNHGDTFPVTFGGEATYGYHCNFHPEMLGTVIVSNAATSSDVSVLIENGPPKCFNPETVSILPSGTVRWYYPPISITAAVLMIASGGQALADEALAANSGCFECHSVNTKMIGPAFHDIAAKYQGNARARVALIETMKKGGKGNWTDVSGGVPMPPYSPRLSDAEIERLVDWVLSL